MNAIVSDELRRSATELPKPDDRIVVKVASTFEEMMQVMTIRAIVFMGEQSCPYREEFDGNDHAGTQLLATVGGEPAGTFRIRYFGDFAKLERLAVRKEFRSLKLTMAIAKFAIELCRRKGFRRVYGHAAPRVVPFWRRFGFKPAEGDNIVRFSDQDYVVVVGDLEPMENRLSADSDHYVLIRPEGDWDRPGVLDFSAMREPDNWSGIDDGAAERGRPLNAHSIAAE